MEMTNKEITDQIYDTLCGNVGMSDHHIAFNPENVLQAECNAADGIIVIQINGRNLQIVISDAPKDYFSKE